MFIKMMILSCTFKVRLNRYILELKIVTVNESAVIGEYWKVKLKTAIYIYYASSCVGNCNRFDEKIFTYNLDGEVAIVNVVTAICCVIDHNMRTNVEGRS